MIQSMDQTFGPDTKGCQIPANTFRRTPKTNPNSAFCQTGTLQNISDATAGCCLPTGHDENLPYDV